MSDNPDLQVITEQLRSIRPLTKDGLRNYIKVFLGVDVPDKTMTQGHSSPMDYLWFSFNSDFETEKPQNADCVVWANRTGGKTRTAAILTLLDAVFKPEIQIRILSGSGYQAGRMYDYFEKFIEANYSDAVLSTKTHPAKRTIFKNGASVEVLVQTEISVRGQHVHKLRCDEVELFKPRVYEAAQYTTISNKGYVAAREVISTMHRPRGLMSRLIKEARRSGQRIFKWNLWDVIAKCERECKTCPLNDECHGRAQKATGYYKVQDALTQLERAKQRSFYMEMLCEEGEKKNGDGIRGHGFIDYVDSFYQQFTLREQKR